MTAAVAIAAPYTVVCSTSNEQLWLTERRTGIGASEAAAACSESEWDSPYSLWARKSGRIQEKEETEPMRWGKLLEGIILSEYGRRSKRWAKPHGLLIRSTEYPWALATLDGETGDGSDAWPLEIKNSSAFGADDWEDGPPRPYYLQTQQQMLVTGARKATIACLLGGNRLVWTDVLRDDIAVNKIIARGSELWRRIQDGDPPKVDGHDATSAALKAIYPEETKGTVLLPASMVEVVDALERAKALQKSVKEDAELHANTLKAAIGDAERAILPDGRAYTFKLQRRASYTVKASETRVLRPITAKL